MNSINYTISTLNKAAHFVLHHLAGNAIIVVDGDMGAGKTTLIKAICSELGVVDTVSSPTFSLVNEYRDKGNMPVYHFDFYRINNEQEALDIGAEEYFYSGNICIVEWAGKIKNIIPEQFILVSLTVEDINSRKLTISYER